jgi:hypothetical protein
MKDDSRTRPASGDVTGVCGRLKEREWARGEEGAEALFDAREDGLEMGLRVGVRKRKGTPATSSRCLCISSNTLCSICSTSATSTARRAHTCYKTHRFVVHSIRLSQKLFQVLLLLLEQQAGDGHDMRGGHPLRVFGVLVIGLRFVLSRKLR